MTEQFEHAFEEVPEEKVTITVDEAEPAPHGCMCGRDHCVGHVLQAGGSYLPELGPVRPPVQVHQKYSASWVARRKSIVERCEEDQVYSRYLQAKLEMKVLQEKINNLITELVFKK